MSVEVVVPKHGGVPPGGNTGENLIKNSSTDYDYQWGVGQGGLLVGQVIFAGSQPQDGYLRCDGAVYARATYPDLAAKIGVPLLASQDNVTANNVRGVLPLRTANNVIFAPVTHIGANTATAGAFSTSTNGSVFTSRTGWELGTSTADARTTVAFGQNVYVSAVGYASNTVVSVATSPDLAGWTGRLLPGSAPTIYEVAFGSTSGVFVAVGVTSTNAKYVATSSTGTSWTSRTAYPEAQEGQVLSVAATSSLILMVASDGMIKSSADGSTYTTRAFSGIGVPCRVSLVGSTFYLTTTTGDIYTTTTATSFTWVGNCGLNGAKIINNGGSMFVATTGTQSKFSFNMTTWVAMESPVSIAANGKFWGRKGGDLIFWMDNNAYNTATHFPVPRLLVEPGIGQIGDYSIIYGWIRT